jgi:hypothetical protein
VDGGKQPGLAPGVGGRRAAHQATAGGVGALRDAVFGAAGEWVRARLVRRVAWRPAHAALTFIDTEGARWRDRGGKLPGLRSAAGSPFANTALVVIWARCDCRKSVLITSLSDAALYVAVPALSLRDQVRFSRLTAPHLESTNHVQL